MTSNRMAFVAAAFVPIAAALGEPAGGTTTASSASGGVTVQLESARLDAVEVGPGDGFGTAVDVFGDTVLVGALNDQATGATRTGAAYVFRRSGTTWSLEARLVAPDAELGDFFGTAVALDEDTAAIGARGEDNALGVDAGSVYVFVRSGTTWTFQQKLRAASGATGDGFGAALDVQWNQLVVGAPFSDGAGLDSGRAYVFERVGTVWNQTATISASGALLGDLFGSSVSLSGATVAVGAPGELLGRGAAYLFTRSGSSWSQLVRLVASDGLPGDRFGRVGLFGNTLVVGAPEALAFAGAAYVFARPGQLWVQTLKLLAPDGQIGDRLSSSVAFDGELIVLGAQGEDAIQSSAGAAYVYRRQGATWGFDRKLLASTSTSVNLVGAATRVFGGTIVAGGPGPFGGTLPGSAYVFDVDPGDPSFCDWSDGALASCPCDNAGLPDTGCDLQHATGGVRLDVVLQLTAPSNRATIAGRGFPQGFSPSAILIRAPDLDAAAPVVFGDGLRCVAVPLVRLGATFASAGVTEHTFGHGAMAGTGTFFYQAWFRNTPAMYCTPDGFNLSNGRELAW